MADFLAAIRARRTDLVWAAGVAILTALVWCLVYHRWTVASWQVPITYLADPQQADVLHILARIRAARDGHQWPILSTDIPQLGAPFVANWDDYPMSEKPLFCAAGLLARILGLFAGANLAVMLGQMLAAISFYAAGRILRCEPLWAAVGAMVFALSRFAFAQGLYHLTILYYWHVPLCLVVCGWLFRGEILTRGRLIFALIVGFLAGVQHVYYANLFGQFVVLGGLAQASRQGWRAALPAAAILGVTALGFLLMEANTLAYAILHGSNYAALDRRYQWLEIYGLKLTDLVAPPPDHSFAPLAAWGASYMKASILSPGENPPSAYLGIIGLASLAWLAVTAFRRLARRSLPPLEAFLVLWTILYGTVGGLNGIVGMLGFDLFRATTRFSIFILGLALLYACRRFSRWEWLPRQAAYPLAALLIVFAWWDQAPPTVSSTSLAATAAAVDSDRNFTQAMEQRLGPGAMVFQLPVMDYPEKGVPGVPPYDHLRPYLYSTDLRFSYGAMKGRPQESWQHAVDRMSMPEIIALLQRYGFSAIYVNLHAMPDRGAALVATLREKGFPIIESERSDLLCIVLQPSAQPVLPALED